MAARQLRRNYDTRYAVFYIDSLSEDGDNLPTGENAGKGDLSDVPCVAFGSIAKAADGKTYILNGQNKWVSYQSAGGSSSGGGGGIDESDVASSEEVDEMLDEIF